MTPTLASAALRLARAYCAYQGVEHNGNRTHKLAKDDLDAAEAAFREAVASPATEGPFVPYVSMRWGCAAGCLPFSDGVRHHPDCANVGDPVDRALASKPEAAL